MSTLILFAFAIANVILLDEFFFTLNRQILPLTGRQLAPKPSYSFIHYFYYVVVFQALLKLIASFHADQPNIFRSRLKLA